MSKEISGMWFLLFGFLYISLLIPKINLYYTIFFRKFYPKTVKNENTRNEIAKWNKPAQIFFIGLLSILLGFFLIFSK